MKKLFILLASTALTTGLFAQATPAPSPSPTPKYTVTNYGSVFVSINPHNLPTEVVEVTMHANDMLSIGFQSCDSGSTSDAWATTYCGFKKPHGLVENSQKTDPIEYLHYSGSCYFDCNNINQQNTSSDSSNLEFRFTATGVGTQHIFFLTFNAGGSESGTLTKVNVTIVP